MKMKKKFEFGKIAFCGTRRINKAVVSMELKTDDFSRKPTLSICGEVWNSTQTDCLTCGQCLDTMKKYLENNSFFMELYRFWKLYHCNCLHAGTRAQEKAVDKYFESNHIPWEYDAACKHLKSVGLFKDHGYEYGSGWVYWSIPKKDLARIKELLA